MAIRHSTAADNSFTPQGKTAWDADHTADVIRYTADPSVAPLVLDFSAGATQNGIFNPVTQWGYNIRVGGNRIETDKGAIYWQIEGNYKDGSNKVWLECHVNTVLANGNIARWLNFGHNTTDDTANWLIGFRGSSGIQIINGEVSGGTGIMYIGATVFQVFDSIAVSFGSDNDYKLAWDNTSSLLTLKDSNADSVLTVSSSEVKVLDSRTLVIDSSALQNPFKVKTSTFCELIIEQSDASKDDSIAWYLGSERRWRLGRFTSETGGNAGSNLQIQAFDDDGVGLGTYLNLNRATAVASFLGSVVARSGTSIPSGGTAGHGLMFSSTSNFGVFFGSGAPTLSAAKGSLYLRSDGSTTNDRAYINTNGSTTWTALITAA